MKFPNPFECSENDGVMLREVYDKGEIDAWKTQEDTKWEKLRKRLEEADDCCPKREDHVIGCRCSELARELLEGYL